MHWTDEICDFENSVRNKFPLGYKNVSTDSESHICDKVDFPQCLNIAVHRHIHICGSINLITCHYYIFLLGLWWPVFSVISGDMAEAGSCFSPRPVIARSLIISYRWPCHRPSQLYYTIHDYCLFKPRFSSPLVSSLDWIVLSIAGLGLYSFCSNCLYSSLRVLECPIGVFFLKPVCGSWKLLQICDKNFSFY